MTHFDKFAALGLILLSACGGGGDGDNPVAEYAGDSARAAQLIAETNAMTKTAAASMPAFGRAEYDGVVGMAFGGAPTSLATAEMIGELDLDANFTTGTITGEFDDFNTRDGQELHGELRLSNGAISGSGFTADARGVLRGGAAAPGAVNASIGGDFLGAGASALAGSGSGTSTRGDVGLIFRGVRDRD